MYLIPFTQDIWLSTASLCLLFSTIRIPLTTTSLSLWSLFHLPFKQNMSLYVLITSATIRMFLRRLFDFVENVFHSIYSEYMALHSFLILAALEHTCAFTTPLCLCVTCISFHLLRTYGTPQLPYFSYDGPYVCLYDTPLLLWNMYLILFTQNIWISTDSLCSLRWIIRTPLRLFFVVFVYLIPLAQINEIRPIFKSRLN